MQTEKRNIIAMETSESICSVALGNGQILLGEITLNKSNAHNERLAWMVDWLLKEQNLSMDDIEAVVISAGPGSYTGLRIGFSFARGLIYPFNTRLITVPTPEVYAFKEKHNSIKIVAVMDARRQELYVGEYRFNNSTLREELPVSVISIADFFQKYQAQKIQLAGSGIPLIVDHAKNTGIKIGWKIPEIIINPVTAKDLYNYGNILLNAGLRKHYNLEEPLYVRDFKGTY